jgi:hypothetical protein
VDEPFPGWVGVGLDVLEDELVDDELLEDELLDDELLEVEEVVVKKMPGLENGSRPANTATGVGARVGVPVEVGVPPVPGGREVVGNGSGVPPPPSRFINKTPTRSTPAMIPPNFSVLASRWLSGIGQAPASDASVGPGTEPGPALASLV